MDKPKRKRKPRKRDPANKKLECPDCGRKFYFNCQLSHHRLVHTGEKPYACNICGKAFNTHYSLKNHKYIHTDEKPFQCSFCKYACRDSSTLRKHQAKHTGMQTTYQCKLCDKSYLDKWRLKLHVDEIHLNVDVKTVPCNQCNKSFKSRSHLNTHIKLVHDRAKSGHCPVCKLYITNLGNLDSHLNTHVDAKPYVCNVDGCKRAYKDKSSLNKHLITHRPDEQYPCDICGRLFPRGCRLTRHVIKVHGKRKHVQCDYCGVKFYSKAYLINHITKKHVKKRKKYICDQCGMITYNKPSIVMHIKHGHGNENDRECTICHTIYKKYIYLKAHYKRTHNIAYKTKTRPPLIVKEEPPDDVISIHSIDLFEVEKTELDIESNPDTVQHHPELQTEIECQRLGAATQDVYDDFCYKTVGNLGCERGKPKKESYVSKYAENIDETTLEHVKKSKIKLLAEARRKNALQALERTRQIYNERMKSLVNKLETVEQKKQPIKIKLFKKKPENCSKVEKSVQIDDQKVSKLSNDEKAEYDENNLENDKTKSESSKDDEIVPKDDELTSSDKQKTSDVNKNKISAINDKTVSNKNKNELLEDDKMSNVDEDGGVTNEEKPEVDDKESSNGDVTSENDETDDDEEWNCKKKQKNSKINFNSHQCYICFKLYETKEKLLDHCKDHFDVCNEHCLKKCPLCPYVTKRTITRHLRLRHGVNVKIPYGKLQDKKDNKNGCRYYFEIDDPLILKMEVIPSVKNLNKIASMKIDKKRREDKYKTLAKTKLVRKGKEWIVETEKINIDKDVIIPEFGSEELNRLDMKIGDSDSYLDSLKKMYHIAKKSGKTMLFPCQSCDKICRNLAALKLHNRKHEKNPKPFKKKVWKHKLKETAASKNKKPDKTVKLETGNRTAKPKPIKNKHKCDPELKDFYENNIRGGDIEFWQFLKIFNKMSRDNINDFKDLESRIEYGLVPAANSQTVEEDESKIEEATKDTVTNNKHITETDKESSLIKNGPQKQAKANLKLKQKNRKAVYKRVIRISKENYEKRNLAKQTLRKNISQRSQDSTNMSSENANAENENC